MAFQSAVSEIYDRSQSIMQWSGSHTVVAASLAAGGVAFLSGLYMYRSGKRRELRRKAEARAERSKRNIEKLTEELRGIKIDTNIVKLSFQELQLALLSGKLTAVDVLRAYQAKALEVHARTNAVCDVIESAADVAAYLDTLAPEERGPLHGIPISLKETCGLKGHDCTSGFAELIDIPLHQDSGLVQVLKLKGAVPFIRTNAPQGMRSFACDNPIYGKTVNPHNPSRGPGGSSSGEGAIIGGHGSILGVGSDIGGSVRIPAIYSGCCSLRPTSGRLGYLGDFNTGTVNGQNLVLSTDGPLGRDVTSLVQFMRSVLCPDLWSIEPSVPPTPFDEKAFNSKHPLRIGYFIHNGCTRSVPAVQRAVMLAKTTLENLGHTLVEVDVTPYALHAFSRILIPLLMADNGEAYDDLLRYDTPSFSMKSFMEGCKLPAWRGWLMSKTSDYDPVLTEILKRKRFRSMDDWFKMTIHVQDFRQNFAEELKRQNIDLVLSPGMASPANTIGLDAKFVALAHYTSMWNVFNFPAGIVPVSTVTKADVERTADPACYKAETIMEKALQADTPGSEGLPLAVQIAGLPYTEETVLRVMLQLEATLASDVAK